jgi:hypothetical protein
LALKFSGFFSGVEGADLGVLGTGVVTASSDLTRPGIRGFFEL